MLDQAGQMDGRGPLVAVGLGHQRVEYPLARKPVGGPHPQPGTAVIVRLLGGPLAGRVLETTDAPWAGGWLTAGHADRGLYVPVHGEPATGIVLAEIQATAPRHTVGNRPAPSAGAKTTPSTPADAHDSHSRTVSGSVVDGHSAHGAKSRRVANTDSRAARRLRYGQPVVTVPDNLSRSNTTK
ncbi:hypothetical protein GCM10010345_86860 [Streptomyces canarius]|uniref:Uncharacterized protein n=1 Tax=Streptomyces canarius TaxID=285453 RepID=A0ABQ3DBA5_9ACTN|nr:hypothetical protein GCM10010345_86860 [Streptomyces canarius]